MFSFLFSGFRQRWTLVQKKIMRKYFKTFLKTKTALRKQQCQEFLNKFPDNFVDVGWLRVKTFIFNECK